MYSEKRRREAVDLWFELYGTISVEDFVAELGYPCASTMSRWIKADPRHDPDRARYDSRPVLTKLQAVSRVAEGASLAQAARESGLAPSAVWRAVDRHARGGTAALLPGWKGEQVAGREKGEGRRPSPAMQAPPPAAAGDLPDDLAALKAMAEELRMDNAILREVLDVLKAACPGPRDLTYAERSLVVFRLSDRFPQGALRLRAGVAKSTYHYNVEAMTRPDGPDWLGDAVEEEPLARKQAHQPLPGSAHGTVAVGHHPARGRHPVGRAAAGHNPHGLGTDLAGQARPQRLEARPDGGGYQLLLTGHQPTLLAVAHLGPTALQKLHQLPEAALLDARNLHVLKKDLPFKGLEHPRTHRAAPREACGVQNGPSQREGHLDAQLIRIHPRKRGHPTRQRLGGRGRGPHEQQLAHGRPRLEQCRRLSGQGARQTGPRAALHHARPRTRQVVRIVTHAPASPS